VYRSLWYIWFFSSGLDENTLAILHQAIDRAVFLGQSEPGDVGLRNMLSGASPVNKANSHVL
jgi:hypothetical protein